MKHNYYFIFVIFLINLNANIECFICLPTKLLCTIQSTLLYSNNFVDPDYVEMQKAVLNDTYSLEMRRSYQNIYFRMREAEKNRDALAAEKAIFTDEKDKVIKSLTLDKAIVAAEKDKEINALVTTLTKLNDDNGLLAPRAVMDYVELFVMEKYNITNGTREQKWCSFFDTTDIGKQIFLCIRKENSLWPKSSKDMAQRMKNIYQYSTKYRYKISLEINDAKTIQLNSENALVQTFNVMNCIAFHCEFRITI